MGKAYLIAEILLQRGMPDHAVMEITKVSKEELLFLKKKLLRQD
ncbi:hypothetical protein [Bacillus massiliglaciei]|nr:hypothetical protein [Bacillus massiliglaciei]